MPFHQPRRQDHVWGFESCMANGCKSCCGCVEAQGQCSGCESLNAFNSVVDVIQVDWHEVEDDDWTNEADEWDVVDGKKPVSKGTEPVTSRSSTDSGTNAFERHNKMPTIAASKEAINLNKIVPGTAGQKTRVGERKGPYHVDTKQFASNQREKEMGRGGQAKTNRPVFLLHGEDEKEEEEEEK